MLPRCSAVRLSDGSTVPMSEAWRRKLRAHLLQTPCIDRTHHHARALRLHGQHLALVGQHLRGYIVWSAASSVQQLATTIISSCVTVV